MDLGRRAAGIGVLADDTRRALYEYVVSQREPVGREQAAAAIGVPVHRASFHLDRLVSEGLLDVEFRRLTGRTGPGAGRPSKLYHRAVAEIAVSLPERRYDLVGDILAAAVTRAAEGTPLDQALDECAREEGLEVGTAAAGNLPDTLASQGYEPVVEDGVLVLGNCPFDALAQKHTELVCGLNRSFVQGVADGLDCDVSACLEPESGRCCVTVRDAG